ncbi:hypothetical protein UFOVP1288_24 [uncultured Caudovirales phage]|uniref:Uncharacterized protein n=1 Tax=uncultured Caudovirales phage TaxID=2100421 RepID=A0A6J5R8C2_9CAUD|nr:hypothetical protein UFOVP1195_24 [uncultured Caudovirales phage]CAB4195562.1 hypothetical protein UFOVP1288_24 [uncultured Caudovirales phage]CAB4204928.1 hypothetical protein UFOVP1409_24 [uncultured Caudovirales phage]
MWPWSTFARLNHALTTVSKDRNDLEESAIFLSKQNRAYQAEVETLKEEIRALEARLAHKTKPKAQPKPE